MRQIVRAFSFVLALLACYAFGFAWRDLRHGELPDAGAIKRLAMSLDSQPTPSPEQIFRDAYNRILADYEGPIKPRDLKFAGIGGMMASLGDPHTMFLEPRDAAEFSSETKANIVGIGARLQDDPLGAKAARVFETGPAYRAGMRADDVITNVDGKPTVGRSLDDVVKQIKGKEGTLVRLQIVRKSAVQPLSFVIKRAQVTIPTVDSKFFDKSSVGYITIATFSEPTAEQFDDELAKLEKHPLNGLIIDLRSNPGGLLESAREMLSRFVENKLVVKMKFRDGSEEVAKTYPGLVHNFSYPITILVNEDSASAAEIFAGALRDYKLTAIVGEHTYGKASVQNVFPLVDGSSAKVTIARYYLPLGADISRKLDSYGQYLSGGLEPDVKVDFDGLDDGAVYGDAVKDPQIAKAIEFIESKQR